MQVSARHLLCADAEAASEAGTPAAPVTIIDCGVLSR